MTIPLNIKQVRNEVGRCERVSLAYTSIHTGVCGEILDGFVRSDARVTLCGHVCYDCPVDYSTSDAERHLVQSGMVRAFLRACHRVGSCVDHILQKICS